MKTILKFWNETLTYGWRTLVRTVAATAFTYAVLAFGSETLVTVVMLVMMVWGFLAFIAFVAGLLEEVTEKPLLSREYGIPYNAA